MLQDPRIHDMVTLYIDSIVFFAKGFKEQISRRTAVTWLMAQAAFIMLLRLVLIVANMLRFGSDPQGY